MFENSLNGNKSGLIKSIKKEDVIYGIEYYDSMYKKTIYVNYDSKELRDKDFKNINNDYFYYSKIN